LVSTKNLGLIKQKNSRTRFLIFVLFFVGNSPGCDHVQIDESKFGKRKYNRGHRVEGVWVFGMVEAINDGWRKKWLSNSRYVWVKKYRAGKSFFCTVPKRNSGTLLAIIHEYVQFGMTIRSDGWKAYAKLHGPGPNCFHHQVVNHSENFSTLDQVAENTVPHQLKHD
jgi:hypothetical protein